MPESSSPAGTTVRVTNLALPVEEPEEALPAAIAERLGVNVNDLGRWRLLRKSLDARQRRGLKYVHSIAVDLPPGVRPRKAEPFKAKRFEDPVPGTAPMRHRPVVVGSGPAGLLAGYYLAKRGYRPLILERGRPVKERARAIKAFDAGGPFEPENNYLFGEGGAGAWSDGKLTCRVTGPDVDYVLDTFVECGGRESLTYEHRPHLGSNKLPMICRNYRRRTEAMGGEYRFGVTVEGLDLRDGKVVGLQTSAGHLEADRVILAIGHSARDTYEALHAAGVPMEAKAFQLGVRIEHPQELVNRRKYGRPEYLELLGAADYSLVAPGQPNGERDLYTFCMCAGGWIIPSVSEPGRFCTNGMSNSRHETTHANSGLVLTLEPAAFGSKHPLAGVEVQRRAEGLAFQRAGGDYKAPVQRATDYLRGQLSAGDVSCSYKRGSVSLNLGELLPPAVASGLHAGLPGLAEKWGGSEYLTEAVLAGPETRGSSPVRIARDRDTLCCPNIDGLYPVGEGAGYAGGIVTAAVDGLRTAKAIVERFAAV
ncbi:NAD(P)/FAD-dependent oxidoreductase [Alienimonas californiensis]|uniref:D-amino acid dehydrogenase small subunit n=1 Tax=Alienimonas californiensis TaxID=2527989 RepID=A0A517P4I3_9PLAN|nr:FAD-dependent oxidoreductase [Alienimonas californiensis]QDT14298.1 D-amino acid dehydrogenase small subunit [Alienimonas californiensis]